MTPLGIGTQARDRKASENPYLGPRAFRRGNTLFGRDREVRDLRRLLVAERIVLMHSPSGAGKTSLIQAALIPALGASGFHVSGPLRVSAVPPAGATGNPYVLSAVQGVTTSRGEPFVVKDAPASFGEWLTSVEERHGITEHVLIFDQFEELVTLDPTDRHGQREFCHQVGEALKAHHRWALFSMREDYMGGLDRYLGLIPTRLRVRYRLDFLDRDAAKHAAQQPALMHGVEFSDAAAEVLVEELARRRIERPGRESAPTGRDFELREGFVEPVQLQVVCHTVWARLSEEHGRAFTRIDDHDVKGYDDFKVALGGYFADTVRRAARKSHVPEADIRRWFEEQLITAKGFRSQTVEPPASEDGNKEKLLRLLERWYLIRGDERNGERWYELSHDGLVEPIRADNRRWLRVECGPWVELAWDWRAAQKDRSRLLHGEALREATRSLEQDAGHADPLVREFVEASKEAAAVTVAEKLRARDRAREILLAQVSRRVALLSIAVVVEAIVILYLALR